MVKTKCVDELDSIFDIMIIVINVYKRKFSDHHSI